MFQLALTVIHKQIVHRLEPSIVSSKLKENTLFQTLFVSNWSVNEVTPSQFTQSFSCLLAQLADWAHLCVVHNTDHITQLLATIGSENMSNVASVLLDFAAPHAQPNLTHWPDGETLKYSLEWWVITMVNVSVLPPKGFSTSKQPLLI